MDLADGLPSYLICIEMDISLSDWENRDIFRELIDLSLHLRIASSKTSHGKGRFFVEIFDLIIIYHYTSIVDCLSILYLRPFNERCGNLL